MTNEVIIKNLLQGFQFKDARLYDALTLLLEQVKIDNTRIQTLESAVAQADMVARNSVTYSIANSTTFVDVPGLEVNLEAAKLYQFEIGLFCEAGVGGGTKLQLIGNLTVNSIIYQCYGIDNTSATIVSAPRRTSLTSFGTQTGATEIYYIVQGTLETILAGNVRLQFAQNVSNGTASKVLAGSFLKFKEI